MHTHPCVGPHSTVLCSRGPVYCRCGGRGQEETSASCMVRPRLVCVPVCRARPPVRYRSFTARAPARPHPSQSHLSRVCACSPARPRPAPPSSLRPPATVGSGLLEQRPARQPERDEAEHETERGGGGDERAARQAATRTGHARAARRPRRARRVLPRAPRSHGSGGARRQGRSRPPCVG